MIRYGWFYSVVIIAFGFLIAGCGGHGDPVGVSTQWDPGQAGLSIGKEQAIKVSDHILLGLFNCSIDTLTGAVEAVPMRTSDLTLNVNNLLNNNSGSFTISNLDLNDFWTDGKISCDIVMTHPFYGLDQFNTFDWWGVFLHDGASSLNYDGLTYSGGPDAGENEAVLLNPDGYTRWFNQPEFDGDGLPILEYYPNNFSNLPLPTATLNPYKAYADNLGTEDNFVYWAKDPDKVIDRGIFRAGVTNARRYEFQFPMAGDSPILFFQFAVIARWAEGDPTLTGLPTYYDPGDFPPEANAEEPFLLTVSTVASDLYYVNESTYGGDFRAELEVFDWQGGQVGGNGVTNEIELIVLESDIFPGGSYEIGQAELEGISSPGTVNSSVYQVEINDMSPQYAGETDLWVIVETAGSYDQDLPSEFPEGGALASFLRSSVWVSDHHAGEFTVNAIDPDSAPFWSYVDDAMITGVGFVIGATVELRKSGQTPVPGTGVTFLDSTSIQCDFDLKDVDSGLWDVVVINPDSSEGILPAGFEVLPWSDEELIATGGFRLPALVERGTGQVFLAVGSDDSTSQYMIYEPTGAGWEGPYLINNRPGNNMINSLAVHPVTDEVFFSSDPHPYYRYPGGPGLWEGEDDPDGDTYPDGYHPVFGCRTLFLTIDPAGNHHIVDNSVDAFGHIIHMRAPGWNSPFPAWQGDVLSDYFQDGWNELVLTEGNIHDYDSSGAMYVIYVKDRKYNQYGGYDPAGPRYIRVTPIPNSGWSAGFSNIEQAYGIDEVLDSPAITCDPSDTVHAAYRKFSTATGVWQISYAYSFNGTNWIPGNPVWEGSTEPGEGFVFLLSDSDSKLNSVYIVDEYMEYRNSTDGISWSDTEIVNESADTLPPGAEDITPRVYVTDGDIMHVVWVRDYSSNGYGELYHRMRDLI